MSEKEWQSSEADRDNRFYRTKADSEVVERALAAFGGVKPAWTCPRCFRIWSPYTLECSHCNDPAALKEWLAK